MKILIYSINNISIISKKIKPQIKKIKLTAKMNVNLNPSKDVEGKKCSQSNIFLTSLDAKICQGQTAFCHRSCWKAMLQQKYKCFAKRQLNN